MNQIQIKFFARLRDQLGCSELTLRVEPEANVGSLRKLLDEQGEAFVKALRQGEVLCAVNHLQVSDEHPLNDGDEVAFFPPVTGG
jgi:molybdopterin synthase sulfur carrier subunit